MAKFAQVGYGHDGRGIGTTQGGYTYIVNDNVRTGDVIVPIPAFNVKAGRDVQTTAQVLSTTKDLSRNTTRFKGSNENLLGDKKFSGGRQTSNEEIRDELLDKGLIDMEEDENGKITSITPLDLKDISTDKGNIVRDYGNKDLYKQQLGERQQRARKYNQEQREQETFDSYSKPFMGEQK